MFEEALLELEKMSKHVGNRPEYVQGGGGNTSVKLSDNLMAVKASGFKLNQMSKNSGYVVVDYKKIQGYYDQVDLDQDTDFEKESVQVAKDNAVDMPGIETLRPSVEAGFHAIMKRYVLHTHPVYANMLCCSYEGKDIMDQLFKDQSYACVWIPYINPGFCLTLKIKEAMEKCKEEKGVEPEVIFMENHGLVITSDDYDRTLLLHEEVNMMIKDYLKIKEAYPEIKLKAMGDEAYLSETNYIKERIMATSIKKETIDQVVLYPDQLVYLNKSISLDQSDNKLMVDVQTGACQYKTALPEAVTIEETFLAYLYVLEQIEKANLSLKVMFEMEIDFINNWESETYRKSLVKRM